jgi:cation diffusion facilitator family transporter
MDLAAAVIAYISVRFADRPPDESHPFGHEKMENISGVIETILIFVASIFIIKEAVMKLLHHEPVRFIGLGFAVMLISSVVNTIVAKRLYAVAKAEGSVAIEADALHLKADVYTSAGVAIGLLIMWVTGFQFLDPVVAIVIALFILKEAYGMLISAFGPLLDAKLSDEEIAQIKDVFSNYTTLIIDYHELRTRRSGIIKHIDLHITIPHTMTVRELHSICDRIESDIEQRIRHTKVLIHGEPCNSQCAACAFILQNQACASMNKS